ncbi:unnamed protein product [Moneuplotes crassus]|uniref:Uncharacterized protein n=1 Tax=Euplotes crassus TaxID=5936 RepID=A0AAD1X558_EUPCR|nr:unnamed protein product [Moneuplotes crassus]
MNHLNKSVIIRHKFDKQEEIKQEIGKAQHWASHAPKTKNIERRTNNQDSKKSYLFQDTPRKNKKDYMVKLLSEMNTPKAKLALSRIKDIRDINLNGFSSIADDRKSMFSSSYNGSARKQTLHRFSRGNTQKCIKINSFLRGSITSRKNGQNTFKLTRSQPKRASLVQNRFQTSIKTNNLEKFTPKISKSTKRGKSVSLSKSFASNNLEKNIISSQLPKLKFSSKNQKLIAYQNTAKDQFEGNSTVGFNQNVKLLSPSTQKNKRSKNLWNLTMNDRSENAFKMKNFYTPSNKGTLRKSRMKNNQYTPNLEMPMKTDYSQILHSINASFNKQSLDQIKEELKLITKQSRQGGEDPIIFDIISQNHKKKFKSTLGDKLVQLETLDRMDLD